jgi:hypothetical protein
MQVFWAWTTSRLIDRLMSRDYGDFAKVEKFKGLKAREPAPRGDTIDDDYAASQASRANTLMAL